METVLNLVVIRSTDLERAERFYAALGVQFARERHGSGPEHLAGHVGSVVLEIYPLGKSSTDGVRLGFRVTALTEVLPALTAAGATVTTAPEESPWGLRAVVIDPDGHRIELIQE